MVAALQDLTSLLLFVMLKLYYLSIVSYSSVTMYKNSNFLLAFSLKEIIIIFIFVCHCALNTVDELFCSMRALFAHEENNAFVALLFSVVSGRSREISHPPESQTSELPVRFRAINHLADTWGLSTFDL